MKYWWDATHEEKVERWENVVRVLGGLSEHAKRRHWDMRNWGQGTDCGTIACAAGHCGLDPWFREQGLTLDPDDPTDPGTNFHMSTDVDFFFGEEGGRIFWNTRPRPVEEVLEEVTGYLSYLREQA